MTPQTPDDFLAGFVRNLTDAGDWPALVCCGMAHQYRSALQQAVVVVERNRHRRQGSALVDFLTAFARNPLNPTLKLTDDLLKAGSPHERAALCLCHLFPRLVLCESADQFPVERQGRLFQIGLQSIAKAKQIAADLQDDALLATLGTVQATGFQKIRALEDAQRSCREAETIYRRLEQTRPGVYLANIAVTLYNLGTVQRALQELEDAKHSYQEALTIYRRLEQARPGSYLADIAMTLHNLGNV